MHRFGGFGALETKFRSFDGELALQGRRGDRRVCEPVRRRRPGRRRGAAGRLRRVAGAAGRRRGRGVKMLWQHDPARPIGVWDEVREDGRGLYVKGRLLLEVQAAREAHVLLQAGAIDGLSIGYRTLRARRPRAASGSCTRSSSGRCRWSPSRCCPRRGSQVGRAPKPRRRIWRGPWRRASARPGRCWREPCRREFSHQGKSSMQKAETTSRAGTAAPGQGPHRKSRRPCRGFLGEFNAFQSEIKSKLQEQETRLAMLDRKSIALSRPHAGPRRRDRHAAQEGLRRLSALGRRRRPARPDRRGEGAFDRGGGGRRLSGRSGDRGPDRRRAALVGLDPDHRQCGDASRRAPSTCWSTTPTSAPAGRPRPRRSAETGTPQVDRISIPLHELSALPKASQRLLDDSAFDVEGWLAQRIADKFSRAEAAAFIAGDGIDKPTGFLNYPKVDNASSPGARSATCRPARPAISRQRSGGRDRRSGLCAGRALPGQRDLRDELQDRRRGAQDEGRRRAVPVVGRARRRRAGAADGLSGADRRGHAGHRGERLSRSPTAISAPAIPWRSGRTCASCAIRSRPSRTCCSMPPSASAATSATSRRSSS